MPFDAETPNDTTNAALPELRGAQVDMMAKARAEAFASLEELIEASRSHDAATRAFTAAWGVATHGGDGNGKYSRPDREHGLMDSVQHEQHEDLDKVRESYRRAIDAGVWSALIKRTGLKDLMDRQAFETFKKGLADDPAEATAENMRATLETLIGDSDLMFKRGLAQAFGRLDRRFKSHDGFKVGARIILTNLVSTWAGYISHDNPRRLELNDVERGFRVLARQCGREAVKIENGTETGSEEKRRAQNLADRIDGERREMGISGLQGGGQSEHENEFFRIRIFKNGNAHLWFKDKGLVEEVNRQLAAYYGEIIPDAAQPKHGPYAKPKSRAVAKDLQFYPTPKAAAEKLCDIYALTGARVLEPSAGEGHLCEVLSQAGAIVDAIEVDPARAAALRGKRLPGVTTVRNNFLEVPASPSYSHVVMNPPFYGTHYMDHVRHAFEFLEEGGILHAILPASVAVNEGKRHAEFRAWAESVNLHGGGAWSLFEDLPAESFAESGTRINTVIMRLRKRAAR